MDKPFQTTDLDLVAALNMMDFPTLDAVPSVMNKHHVVFSFADIPELKDYVKAYRLGETMVEPVEFYNQIRKVRMQINQIIELNK